MRLYLYIEWNNLNQLTGFYMVQGFTKSCFQTDWSKYFSKLSYSIKKKYTNQLSHINKHEVFSIENQLLGTKLSKAINI